VTFPVILDSFRSHKECPIGNLVWHFTDLGWAGGCWSIPLQKAGVKSSHSSLEKRLDISPHLYIYIIHHSTWCLKQVVSKIISHILHPSSIDNLLILPSLWRQQLKRIKAFLKLETAKVYRDRAGRTRVVGPPYKKRFPIIFTHVS